MRTKHLRTWLNKDSEVQEMLTDNFSIIQGGRLNPDIQLPSTAKLELMDFIAMELPRWRDHTERPAATAETILTGQLCDHLNSVTYYSTDWSHVQFRTEVNDEISGGRTIDLALKPRGAALIIEGRRCSQFDTLFPIECKRLPTPKAKDRDEREYVITQHGTTGGIQRFKFGYHGAAHKFAAMIGYVQELSFSHWLEQVNSWIQILATERNSQWSNSDRLQFLGDDLASRISTMKSKHDRTGGLDPCELHHLWIMMNAPWMDVR
jgi:hypothetical protein